MFARRSHGPRAVITFIGALLVPLALSASVVPGCGTSGSGATPSPEGGYTTVVTSGGGVPAVDAGPNDPFSSSGGSASSGSGSSSGSNSSGSSSGQSLDSGSSSGGDASDDSSSSSSGGGCNGSSSGSDSSVAYTPPSCDGMNPCDLRSNTCCLSSTASGLVGHCLPGTTLTCSQTPTPQATVHCLQAAECGAGMSCCGDVIQLLGQVRSSCVCLAQGQSCPYVPATIAQAGVQLCKTDAECKNVDPDSGAPLTCIHQTCIYGAVLDICGLQSGPPLNCH